MVVLWCFLYFLFGFVSSWRENFIYHCIDCYGDGDGDDNYDGEDASIFNDNDDDDEENYTLLVLTTLFAFE